MLSVIGEEAARHTHCSMVGIFTYNKPEFCLSIACRCCCCEVHDTLQYHTTPSTQSLCCAEHSCSMAWPSSIPEPSPKTAPQQQMTSLPSAGFPQTLCSQAVLSKEGCSRGPFIVEAMLIVTTLSCSLPFSLLLCAVRSWYGGCCCATRGLRVCDSVPIII